MPPADFDDSLLADVAWMGESMERFPDYTVLNFCRGYAFLRDGLILSKAQGAEWALENLEEKWRATIQKALAGYQADGEALSFDDEEIRSFYNEMVVKFEQTKIKQQEIIDRK